MEILTKKRFKDSEDWSDQFKKETSEEIRRGMISAFLNEDNFLSPPFKGRERIWFDQAKLILGTLDSTEVDRQTMTFGLMQVCTKLLTRDNLLNSPYGGENQKETYNDLMNLLHNAQGIIRPLEDTLRKHLKRLLWEILCVFDPVDDEDIDATKFAQVVIAYNFDKLLIEAVSWLGSESVINELIKNVPEKDTRFSNLMWDRAVSQHLAIHLAAAGYLNATFQEKLAEI